MLFLKINVRIVNLILEAITISSIIGASTFAVWFAKSRFQPDIETSVLIKIEAAAEPEEEETIVSNRRRQQEPLIKSHSTTTSFDFCFKE
jgi:hypothetical protein